MWPTFKLFFRDPWVLVGLVLTLGLHLALWFYLFQSIIVRTGNDVDTRFFLHYSSVFGVDLVGGKKEIFLIPLSGLLFIFINGSLSLWWYTAERFIARLLIMSAGAVQAALAVAIWLIVRLNI